MTVFVFLSLLLKPSVWQNISFTQNIFYVILLFSLYYLNLIGKIIQWPFHLKIIFDSHSNKQTPGLIFHQKSRSPFLYSLTVIFQSKY